MNAILKLSTPTLRQTERDVLFSGVRELVLSAAVVGLLDPWVGPQAFDSCDVRLIKTIDLFNVHLLHEHGIRLWSNKHGNKQVRLSAQVG